MIRLATVSLSLALALAACNQGPSVSLTNASAEDVAKTTAASGAKASLRPGQWETTVEFVSVEMPGMPAGAADMMKQKGATTTSYCMTEEQARNPKPENFSPDKNSRCTFRNYTLSDGKLDATMVCPGAQGEMVMTMSGGYTAESTNYEAEMATTGPGGQSMKLKTKVTGRRTGECTPDKKG